MFHDSCKYYLIHLRFLYQDIIFVSYISYKNYLSNLTYIFLLFYISVAVFEYFCEYVNYLWIYRNRLIKIEPSSRPSRVEFSKKGESQWRQSETVVSTGMHNVHPARIEKSSQLDYVYCLGWFNRIPAWYLEWSRSCRHVLFSNSSFFDICIIYN